jgi:cell division protein FtsI/penicillin-binding protein 2
MQNRIRKRYEQKPKGRTREIAARTNEVLRALFSNRLFYLTVFAFVLFYIPFSYLFEIQLVRGKEYAAAVEREFTYREVALEAPRGGIYDRYGRPLAINRRVTVLKVDASMQPNNAAEVALSFVRLMELYGEEIIISSPIQISEVTSRGATLYEYTFRTEAQRRYWLRDMDIIDFNDDRKDPELFKTITADMAMEHLYKFFKIPEDLSAEDRRLVLEVCAAIYMERLRFTQITVARNIKEHTAAAVQERGATLPNFYVDYEYLREYPAGRYVAQMIGYVRGISETEFNEVSGLGYTRTDLYGKAGVERAFEVDHLRGRKGIMRIELSGGRRISSEVIQPPVAGDDVFLSIDLDLQIAAVDALERTLTQILVNKLTIPNHREDPLFPWEVMSGLFKTDSISVAEIMEAEEGRSRTLRTYIEANTDDSASLNEIRTFIVKEIEAGRVTPITAVGVMVEQGVVSATDNERSRIQAGTLNVANFLADKLRAGELTPQMVFCAPYSGSVVMVNVKDGSVLAAANYPNYDNNYLVNNFDNNYWAKLMNDPTFPMINRAFSTARAPGSTFKMITAFAGLEHGVITPTELIYDSVSFTKASTPYPRCWHTGSHGWLNVVSALECSCNYFFYETMFRLGNAPSGTMMRGIDRLNDMMRMFGLGSYSGVEITEGVPNISSPMRKEQIARYNAMLENRPVFPYQYRWNDGDSVRTAIGQSINEYTPMRMARYIGTIATRGVRYESTILHQTVSACGVATVRQPVVEEILDLKPTSFTAVMNGMHRAVNGTNGTAKGIFDDFPYVVAGKTGTAQSGTKWSDTNFACFAPFDDPQVVVFVVFPFGNTATSSNYDVKLARELLEVYFKLGENAVSDEGKAVNGLVR